MTEHYAARDMWAALSHAERKKILAALDADEVLHDHDWAGLPPQVHAGIVAGMPVEGPTEEGPRSRRKKDNDD